MTIENLKAANWLFQPSTQRVFSLLEQGGYQVRVVGGAVRNTLLGVPISDIDFATTALPEQVIECAQKVDIQCIPTGLVHGTVSLVIEGEVFEVTTLRTDEQTDGRHAVVSFTDDWAADAMRRDFTINALYGDSDGALFDPLSGFPDIARGRVAFIGHAHERISEDYLRILRFFRFYAQYGVGDIDKTGFDACISGGAGLRKMSTERIHAELMKLLIAPRAVEAVTFLYQSGLFGVMGLTVPRLTRFKIMVALEEALGRLPNALLRLAALFVDMSEDIEKLDKQLRFSKQQKQSLNWFAELPFEAWFEQQQRDSFLYYKGAEAVDMHLMRFLLNAGKASVVSQDYASIFTYSASWQKPSFPVTGQDLMAQGFRSGPVLGQSLKMLESHWVDSGFSVSKKELLSRL